MVVLGEICIKDFLQNTGGKVRGKIFTDGKDRYYSADYKWVEADDFITISRADGNGVEVRLRNKIPLDEKLIAFFGLYSGDGAKGVDDPSNQSRIIPNISFSQKEPNLVRFAIDRFRDIFDNVHFAFAIGEDCAYFMAGAGEQHLKESYGGSLPEMKVLSEVRKELNAADKRYLEEKRPVEDTNENYLAFYYNYKDNINKILMGYKHCALESSGIILNKGDKIVPSVRRPFKKGARKLGGTSRSDEIHVGGIRGIGELFLKIMHDIEQSVYDNAVTSPHGLIVWEDDPSKIGINLDILSFFGTNPYGQIAGDRPDLEDTGEYLVGIWPRSKKIKLLPELCVNPAWCYVAGLYLAEGTTPKETLFTMFKERPKSLGIGFTSTENQSIQLVLMAFQQLFCQEDCLSAWKVKVGSQYFPELVVTGLKRGVPMLRGGDSGDGKMRTMEISIAIKDWALTLAPCLHEYEQKFSHVEPTGAGISRIDFWASSTLARWYFPLIMFTVFHDEISEPTEGFYA